jgi:hypothetical protein
MGGRTRSVPGEAIARVERAEVDARIVFDLR